MGVMKTIPPGWSSVLFGSIMAGLAVVDAEAEADDADDETDDADVVSLEAADDDEEDAETNEDVTMDAAEDVSEADSETVEETPDDTAAAREVNEAADEVVMALEADVLASPRPKSVGTATPGASSISSSSCLLHALLPRCLLPSAIAPPPRTSIQKTCICT